MRHLRADYDAIQPFPVKRPHIVKIDGETVDASETRYLGKHVEPLIPDDEPVFLIRGQDPAGAGAVHAYARFAEAAGADPEFVHQIDAWAEQMHAYAEGKQHGAPDVPPGLLRVVSGGIPRGRYAQCDGTCTVDCGHCKGAGRPAPVAADAEQEWLVDLCVCGHHITAHAKGKDACRYHPGDCTAYRWDEVGIRRVPAAARPAEQIPYMLENTPEEFQRVRDLAWPSPTPVVEAEDPDMRVPGPWDGPGWESAVRPAPVAAEGNERRLAWFTDDELVAELRRRTPAAEGTDELREALIAALRAGPRFVETEAEVVDILLAGPLADLIRERDALLAKVQAVEALAGELEQERDNPLGVYGAADRIRRALGGESRG